MEIGNKNAYIGGLLAIIFVVIVSYFAFSSHLNMFNEKWDVHINSINTDNIEGEAASKEIIISDNKLSVTFKTELKKDKDSITYKIEVINDGNIKAKLDDIKFNTNSNIKYSYAGIEVDEVINPNETKEFTITLESINNKKESEDISSVNMDLYFTEDK